LVARTTRSDEAEWRTVFDAAGAGIGKSFAAVWNNPEDDAYDAL
jgi:hypothetical protein